MVIAHMDARAARPLDEQTRDADVGLTEREAGRFSFLRAIRALANPTDKKLQKDAAFEFDASRAAATALGKEPEGIMVPPDVLRRSLIPANGQRGMNSGTAGATPGNTGGYSIATELMASSFIDILRNRATLMQLGITLGGLVGNVDIPKQTGATTGYWIGEDEDATESELDLGQISLTPKTVAAYSEISRRLMMQSSIDVEGLVRFDLAKQLALTIDKAGYYGTGTNSQPLGIANTAGINAKSFGAGGSPTFVELVDMETKIASANADVPGMAYVGNAKLRGYAKSTLKFPAAAIPQGGTIWEPGNTINGYRTEITNQIADGDVFFGNFADLIIAMWGGFELRLDPYSNSKSGRLRVIVFQDVDMGIRHNVSFTLGR